MTTEKKNVDATAQEVLRQNNPLRQGRQFVLWIVALVLGGILGWMNIPTLNALFNFIASVFTRLFQFVAVPTIALAVMTTLSALGAKKETRQIFGHALVYTLLTTISAAAVGLALVLMPATDNRDTLVKGIVGAKVGRASGRDRG